MDVVTPMVVNPNLSPPVTSPFDGGGSAPIPCGGLIEVASVPTQFPLPESPPPSSWATRLLGPSKSASQMGTNISPCELGAAMSLSLFSLGADTSLATIGVGAALIFVILCLAIFFVITKSK